MAKPRTFKQRQADRARMATHSIPFAWQSGARVMLYREDRVACGKKVYVDGVRTRTVTNSGGSITCTTCTRLLAMTEAEYSEHILAEAKKLQDVRTAQQAKAAVAKQKAHEEKWAEVHKYEDDALVALDAYLSGIPYEHMDEVLEAAVLRYRLLHPESRGEKLWLFSGSEITDEDGIRREIQCRFCRRQIGIGRLGRDYSRSWFDVRSWREFNSLESARNTYGNADTYVSVGRHTTLCALAYLAGVPCAEPVPE